MIGALGRIGALALALLIGVTAPTAALDAPGSAADTAEPTPGSETASNRPADLGGRWRELPRSPFAAVSPVAVWANDHMVAIDPNTGRTATYDPPMRRWEEHQPLPSEPDSPTRSFEGVTGAVAAGGEVIARALYVGPDDDWYAWYAFDPLAGRWRDVAASPFERNVGGLPAWTGELLVMVAEDRSAAAYDPAADRWLEMPPAPLPELPEDAFTARVAEWSPRSLHWTGEELLAVIVRDAAPPLDRTGIVSFDPTTWAWASRSLGPIERSSAHPLFVEGSLWFMSGEPNDRYITNATYDPATDTWTELEARCPLGTHRATWTGELIMEPYWDRRAFDPATGECFRIPASK